MHTGFMSRLMDMVMYLLMIGIICICGAWAVFGFKLMMRALAWPVTP